MAETKNTFKCPKGKEHFKEIGVLDGRTVLGK
jgi:hypothetical protein